MTTITTLLVTEPEALCGEKPFSVKMELKPRKSDAARILRQFCKARNTRRATPLAADACALSRTADGSDAIPAGDDVRFHFDADDGAAVAFVVAVGPAAPAPRGGVLKPAPAAAAARPAKKQNPPKGPAKPALKGGFLNRSPKRGPAAPSQHPPL